MFDGGVVNEADGETIASYELEWKAIHQTLCDLARRRVELEAEEGTYLLEAEDLRVYKRVGYRSMVEYMVGELGYTRHAANERLRVTRELLALPKLAAAYRAGELCFSKVRELTRVVTPQTEEAFLVEAAGKDSHQVAKMVSGLRRGDRPDAVPDPALVTTRVVFELHAEAASLLAWRTRELKAALGRAPTNDERFIALCTSEARVANVAAQHCACDPDPAINATDPAINAIGSTGDTSGPGDTSAPTGDDSASTGDATGPTGDGTERTGRSKRPKSRAVPPPSARQLFLTCKHCERSELIANGQGLVIDRATAELLSCDAEIVGDADSDDHTRVTSAIPAAIRRKVFMRDKFQCVVPGCTASQYLAVHHLAHREHSGTHTMSNCCTLCFHHHKAHHDGLLEISGIAPHRLEFTWRVDAEPTWDEPTN